MESGELGLRIVVSGKVQGVFFRASTAREALRLGVRGHAVNLPDGSVEVLAIGPAPAVQELCRWLERGPPAARVDSLDAAAAPAGSLEGVSGFRTG